MLLKTFLPYLRCLGPVAFGVIFVFAWVITRRMIRAWMIIKPIPPNGFASIEDEIRYVNDEPAEQRRVWGYKSIFIFGAILMICGPLSYLLPAVLFK